MVQKREFQGKPVYVDAAFSASNKIVSKEILEKLILNLNQDKNNADEGEVKSTLATITNKQIIKVAKENKVNWVFKNKYSSKSERKILFKDIKSFKLFSNFYEKASPTYIINTPLRLASKEFAIKI